MEKEQQVKKHLTPKQRREKCEAEAVALREAVEKSRREWLGKRIRFRDLLDKKIKEGVFTEVTESGHVTIAYQFLPWDDPEEEPACILTFVGHEQEALDLYQGVVIVESEVVRENLGSGR